MIGKLHLHFQVLVMNLWEWEVLVGLNFVSHLLRWTLPFLTYEQTPPALLHHSLMGRPLVIGSLGHHFQLIRLFLLRGL